MNADERARKLLAQMTPDEKLELLSGEDNMYTSGVPRLACGGSGWRTRAWGCAIR